MIVTIDGPAGAGKSSVAKALARRLGFQFLDTGAMYRAVALMAIRSEIDLGDADSLAELAQGISLTFDGNRVAVDGEDVTEAIRANDVTTRVRPVADNVDVRKHLIELQRDLARGREVVTEGRDQGTLAFPDAELKVYLTASPEQRARRRMRDLLEQGESVTFEDVLRQQERRDQEDETRQFGALTPASDAVLVDTDVLSLEQVVDEVERLAREKMN